MLLTAAVIETKDGKQYRILDTSDGCCYDIEYAKIYNAICRKTIDDKNNTNNKVLLKLVNGEDLKGFRQSISITSSKHNLVSSSKCLIKQDNLYSILSIPRLNENKELIDSNDEHRYIPIGWHGFGKNRCFYCIDYKCQLNKFNYSKMEQLINDGNINGAHIINDRIHLYKDLNNELGVRI